VALGTLVHAPGSALAMVILTRLSTAFGDVIIDAVVVERSRDAPQAKAGSLQSLCWGSRVGFLSWGVCRLLAGYFWAISRRGLSSCCAGGGHA
jgi:BT1 family